MGTIETAMALIAGAGDSKSYSLEAISAAREGYIDKAWELLEKGKEAMVEAHDVQTDLLRKEMSGELNETSLLMIHAQDHLMNAMLVRQMAEEFILLYQDKYKESAQ